MDTREDKQTEGLSWEDNASSRRKDLSQRLLRGPGWKDRRKLASEGVKLRKRRAASVLVLTAVCTVC
ncbi:hypothetical protein EXN66_Car017343 [Channa argus]|uniref:Uncharacterized protein n=1 Tax=Channa argus TaxID=215402 RepID=A0A6G1QGH0_CHAAH|nr:hypothetical protein EXN66_Car017343 [Channa argus]